MVKTILVLFFVKHIRESKREEKLTNKILLAPPEVMCNFLRYFFVYANNYHTLSGA